MIEYNKSPTSERLHSISPQSNESPQKTILISSFVTLDRRHFSFYVFIRLHSAFTLNTYNTHKFTYNNVTRLNKLFNSTVKSSTGIFVYLRKVDKSGTVPTVKTQNCSYCKPFWLTHTDEERIVIYKL